jgi:hypothetical protein
LKTVDDDYKGARYPMHGILNVDQIPFELDNQPRKCYVPHDTASMAQISGPKDGSKRFGTLQVLLHGAPPPAKQARLAMFMKGGGSVYASEASAYHPGVDVYFSPKAWFNKTIAEQWASKTLKDYVQENLKDQEWILLQDNLHDQKDRWHTLFCILFLF